MLRGRVVSLKGTSASDFDAPPEAAWVLRGDRGITYEAHAPEGSVLTEGEWWPADYSGEPLVSFIEEEGRQLGLEIGDELTVNVLGRQITARIANFREVEWQSLAINFVMVFSPNTFAGAPHAHLATVTYDEQPSDETELALLREVTAAFPGITSVRISDALDEVNALVEDLALAVRGAASITLIASILVLAGALAAGHRHRLYDAVILKTLGATRGRILGAFLLEYALLGLAAATFGLAAGSLAAFAVLEYVMTAGFTFLPSVAFGAVGIALLLTVGLGLDRHMADPRSEACTGAQESVARYEILGARAACLRVHLPPRQATEHRTSARPTGPYDQQVCFVALAQLEFAFC
jgi:putative ABC transport system permease protein